MRFGKNSKDFVIDPSEIIIDKSGSIREETSQANPWIRFLARFLDYAWFFLLLLSIRWFFKGSVFHEKYESIVPIEFFIWIPIEALFLWLWGTTPGKWFLKIQLKQARRSLDFTTALRRSFRVWFRGLGMMMPVINCICLSLAYYRLNLKQWTSWDKEDHILISHRPVARWRVIFAASLGASMQLLYFISKK